MISGPISQQSVAPSSTTLYVRNLPTTCSEEEIIAVFQNYGNIRDTRFQKKKETGEFNGSVFIEYIHASAAKLAQIQIHSKLWGGKSVQVDFAKERLQPKEEKQIISLPSPSIYITNLPSDCDKNLLLMLFSRFGNIIDARPLKTEYGNTKGVAFIDFELQESAAAAIDALDNTMYQGKSMRVTFAANPSKRKGDRLEDPDAKRFKLDHHQHQPIAPMYYDPSQYPYPQSMPVDPMWYAQSYY